MNEAANIALFDRETGSFDDKKVGNILGGPSFSIHDQRPYWYKGNVFVNRIVGWDSEKGQPIMKAQKRNDLKSNATLMRDEWIEIDKAVLKMGRDRLVGASDLMSRGLTYNLTNPMGKTVLEYQDMNDPGVAQIDMDGETRGPNDQPDYLTKYLPIPIIHADFTIPGRQLEASRNSGDAIDTTVIEAGVQRVYEKIEDLLFTDTSYTYGNGTIYSYLSYTNKNSVTLTVNWDASSKTGAMIKDDVLAIMQAAIDAKHHGPFVMYIPKAYQTVMGDDYVTSYPKSIRERLLEIEGLEAIKVADRLPDNTVVLVEMQSRTVRMVNGFMPMVVQWQSGSKLTHHFKVMAIQVPQIRADQGGNCGVVVLSA